MPMSYNYRDHSVPAWNVHWDTLESNPRNDQRRSPSKGSRRALPSFLQKEVIRLNYNIVRNENDLNNRSLIIKDLLMGIHHAKLFLHQLQ